MAGWVLVKVALLSDCYLPRLGGIEVQVHDLAHHLTRAGHTVEVFTATGASHLDMAYVMDREWAKKQDCSWSLKPVADALGFRDTALESMRGESAYEAPAHMLAAYNIHDSLITLRLALFAAAFEHEPSLSLGLREKIDS